MSGNEPAAVAQAIVAAPQVLDALPCGIIVRDATGHIVYANDEAHRIVGWAPGTLLGARTIRRDGLAILNMDGQDEIRLAAVVSKTRKPLNNVQQRLRIPGSGERRIIGNWWPVIDVGGEVRQVVTTFVDITPSVEQADHRLWLENHVLQTLLGVALVLQNPEARRRAADLRDELDWAADILRDLAKDIRRAAGPSPYQAGAMSPHAAPGADSPPAPDRSVDWASV